jgi:hypothetical protein
LVGADAGVGFEPATTFIPLFQTNFFPDLMQVNFLPDATEVIPALTHFAPALATALAGIRGLETKRVNINKKVISFLFMLKASPLTYNLELLHIHS